MEAWEYMGMTREEYDEAMRQMGEDLGVDAPPSDANMMGMHIEHVLDNVIPEGQRNGFTTEAWDDVALAIEEGDILQMEYADEAPGLVDRLAAFAHENGYDPRAYGAGSVHDWADRRGREIAAREGKAWPVPHDTAIADTSNDMDAQSVHDVAFDKMLDFCVEHNQPWSKKLHDEMNSKILEEVYALDEELSSVCSEVEMERAQIALVGDMRERDGINGDEPNLPAYEAERYMYGVPAEELMSKAMERQRVAEQECQTNMKALHERVFMYDNREFDALPDAVRGNLRSSDFHVSQSTYRVLSQTGYDAFYRDTLQEYARVKQNEYRGVDFSKSAKQPAHDTQKQTDMSVSREAPKSAERVVHGVQTKSYVPHDYTPKFTDERQGKSVGDFGDN